MVQGEFQVLPLRRAQVMGVLASSRRSFPRHAHDEYGIGIIEHGAQRSASGRGVVEAGPGDIITVNPGEIHDGAPIGDAPRRWRMLYFSPALIRDASLDLGGRSSETYEFEAPRICDASASRRVAKLFQLYARGAPGDALHSEESLLAILSALSARRRIGPRASGFPMQVLKAKVLADEDPSVLLTLADLAFACGLSRFQTLRAFARATGFTPHAYLVQRRIELARTLIRNGSSLVDAALASGFVDQSHMTRVFVARYGYSPGAYATAAR